jgi:hypothetical protein
MFAKNVAGKKVLRYRATCNRRGWVRSDFPPPLRNIHSRRPAIHEFIREFISPSTRSIVPREAEGLRTPIREREFISPRTRVHCPGRGWGPDEKFTGPVAIRMIRGLYPRTSILFIVDYF